MIANKGYYLSYNTGVLAAKNLYIFFLKRYRGNGILRP